jgi:hypothetical protein
MLEVVVTRSVASQQAAEWPDLRYFAPPLPLLARLILWSAERRRSSFGARLFDERARELPSNRAISELALGSKLRSDAYAQCSMLKCAHG